MSEVILQVEKRDDNLYWVTYQGRELGLLASPIYPETEYRYDAYSYPHSLIKLSIVEPPPGFRMPPPKPKRTVARSLGLRRPK